ncbi:hypothetical protein LOCC1_G001679 [Lachnellula occidentalis]|uniref:Uncharacterized protein n=1 Tax=Lachnellula occidentalis TaxID=215460 RepID=A0A8H8S874_9HELO|nr:hypothetical protein LOCC1_G001679 [Lachnellula occidentalis]
MNYTLKQNPKLFSCPIDLRSDILVTSPVPTNSSPRNFYLKNLSLVSPPLISASSFVPRNMVEHLMRNKRDSAIGVKFMPNRKHARGRADEITNMEGAMHTFVTPVMSAVMTGDYRYSYGHGVTNFGDRNGMRRVRNVVLSASIQMDFEGPHVMLEVARLRGEEVHGKDLLVENDGLEILARDEKQDDGLRNEYDGLLRRHMVYHLTKDHSLPARNNIDMEFLLSVQDSITYLEGLIAAPESHFRADLANTISTRFTELPCDQIVSLELLLNTAIHQVRNEISALESMCPQGYVYTYSPPSIFAREMGATILNRLLILALKIVSQENVFKNMRVFGFDDYEDKTALEPLKKALEKQSHVEVCSKNDLFQGQGGEYDPKEAGDRISKLGAGAMLVVHNNSDGFGQNIETEHSRGSLDGAVGANSSGAASLERERGDLVGWIF